MDFDAYVLRIADADGDVVDEGDDVTTVPNNYGTARTSYSVVGAIPAAQKVADRKLFIYDVAALPALNADNETATALQNVRMVDGSEITVGFAGPDSK